MTINKKNLTPLKTKTSPPNYENTLVERQRLIVKNPQDLLFKTTLFVAPAGYGKSTLLYQYYQQAKQEISCTWLNLDESDNDASNFFYNLVFACTKELKINPDFIKDLNQGTGLQEEKSIEQLIYKIEETEKPLLLFIDDAHYLKQKNVLALFKKLLFNASPYLGFVIASRTKPKIGWSQLKLHQQLVEYTLDKLSFNQTEATALFQSFSNISVSNDQFQIIQQHTEGWAASIQLLAMATQHHTTDDLLAHLKSPIIDIAEYLEEIVLQQQSPELQEFLLKTSILDRFTIDLCQFVSGSNQALTLLEEIKLKQLFLIPLDAKGHWYRYHHLFQSYLKEKLQRQQPNIYQPCFKQASKWCEQNGLITEAIHYALKGKLYNQVTNMLTTYNASDFDVNNQSKDLTHDNNIHLYINFVNNLPKSYLPTQPLLRLNYIKHLIMAYDHKLAKQELKHIDAWIKTQQTTDDNNYKILSKVIVNRSLINCTMLSYSDQIETLHEACINWLRKNSNISDYQRAQVNFYFAYACSLIGDFKQAEIALEESLSIAHYLKNIKLVIHTYVIQTWVLLIAGKPKLANKTLNNALASEHFDSGYQSLLMLSMAETSRQLGKIDYDLNHLLMLKNIAKQTNNTAYGFACFYATISKYLWLSGKYIEATQTLKNDQKELIATENSALSNSVLIDELIRQLLFNKELDEATLQKNLLLEFITKYPNSDKIATQYIQEHLDMIDTRLYLFKKNHKKSLDLLTPLIEQATAQERNNRLVQLLIMQAWAYQQATQEKQALASLKQAFAISIPNGIIMVYIEEGYAIKALIKKCITLIIEKETNDIFKQYQQALLNVLAIDLIPESPKTALETPTKNLLTQKEREILKLLNSLDSLKVVADKAQITYMTLRWHTKNIYRKLEVYRRADAVEKVKQLKLI